MNEYFCKLGEERETIKAKNEIEAKRLFIEKHGVPMSKWREVSVQWVIPE